MSRSAYLRFITIFGSALPLLIICINYAIRFLPADAINLPHRDHWLAPELYNDTFAYLFRTSIWFACLALCFVIGIHWLVVLANNQTPPRLQPLLILGLTSLFIASLLILSIDMFRHFRRVD